jgi:hypothetical protein
MVDIDLTPFWALSPSMKTFFWTCFTIWLSTYMYFSIRYGKKKFASLLVVHDVHAIGMVICCALSLYFKDDDKFSELTPMLFTLSYFFVDLFDCLVRLDGAFTVHALLSIGVCLTSASHPIHLRLRSVSQGGLTELSTYPLHQWQRSKSRQDFLVFALLFTLCRIIWIPYFIYHVYIELGYIDFQIVGGMGLFFLNFTWWFKILNILFNYKEKKDHKAKTN